MVKNAVSHVCLCVSTADTLILSQKLMASIIACSFLCLFPEHHPNQGLFLEKIAYMNFSNLFQQMPMCEL